MAKTALKLAPEPISPEREALAATLARIKALEGELLLNEKDIQAARESIAANETELEKLRNELASAPALSRRTIRQKIEDLAEFACDLADHLAELQRKRGHFPGAVQVAHDSHRKPD